MLRYTQLEQHRPTLPKKKVLDGMEERQNFVKQRILAFAAGTDFPESVGVYGPGHGYAAHISGELSLGDSGRYSSPQIDMIQTRNV